MKPPQITKRVLPPKYKEIIDSSFIVRFTLKERLQILIGYNLDLHLSTWTEHGPGKVKPHLQHRVTKKL